MGAGTHSCSVAAGLAWSACVSPGGAGMPERVCRSGYAGSGRRKRAVAEGFPVIEHLPQEHFRRERVAGAGAMGANCRDGGSRAPWRGAVVECVVHGYTSVIGVLESHSNTASVKHPLDIRRGSRSKCLHFFVTNTAAWKDSSAVTDSRTGVPACARFRREGVPPVTDGEES